MSIAQEIQKLEELRRSGALSDQEFHHAKQKVLDGETWSTGFPMAAGVSADGTPLVFGFQENTWCLMMHLSQLLAFASGGLGFVVPVVMWAMTKDQSATISQHGTRIINWLLSFLIYSLVSGVLCMVLIGFPMLIAVLLMSVIFPIVAAMKANNGELWSYPLTIRFLPEYDVQYESLQEPWN